jgi:EF hand
MLQELQPHKGGPAMSRKKIIAVAGAMLCVSASVLAGEPTPAASEPPPGYDSFAALDTNRDGVLTFSEVFLNPRLANNFNVLDKNADGVLSREEVQGYVR